MMLMRLSDSACKNETVKLSFPQKSIVQSPNPYDKHLYKARDLIENFFAKL